jgi:pimeloyl-ACP methyl ester carboxylesterase
MTVAATAGPSQPWNGNEMDTYADDLATLMDTLDLKNAALIGFSAGGGEVARYIGRHGTASDTAGADAYTRPCKADDDFAAT